MKRFQKVITFVLILIFVLSATACTSEKQVSLRIQEALDKVKEYSAFEIKGKADAKMNMGLSGQNMTIDLNYEYNIKIKGENMVMVSDINTGFMDMNMEMYLVDGTFLMRMPILSDKYIDATDMLDQVNKDAMKMDLSAFDFDVENTELNIEETRIKFQGMDTDVLKVKVLLDEEKLTDLIKKLYAQQNFSSDAFSGQNLNAGANIYDSIDIESASYTLYIDKNNNVLRYEISTVFSTDMQSQKVTTDMNMEYNIVNTGDSVQVNMPQVGPQDIISLNDIFGF